MIERVVLLNDEQIRKLVSEMVLLMNSSDNVHDANTYFVTKGAKIGTHYKMTIEKIKDDIEG